MVTSSNDNLLRLASLMIAEIEGFFISMHVGLRHPVSEFSFESGRNAFFVIYAGNGMPLKAGVLLGTMPEEERTKIVSEVETLAQLGYAASYRLLDLGSELLATQIGRILLDLFGATLPLSAAPDALVASASAARATVAQQEIDEQAASEESAGGDVPAQMPLPAAVIAGAMGLEGLILPKRKRGRPRKEEVLARQALLAAQAQAESGYPIPIVQHGEVTPRRRGRPRKVEPLSGAEQAQTHAVVAAAMESLFGTNGTHRHGNGEAAVEAPEAEAPMVDSPVVESPVVEVVETPAPQNGAQNGNGHANGTNGTNGVHAAQPVVEDVIDAAEGNEQPEEEENGGSADGGFATPMLSVGGLPLTKNQRREMRRRELERIRRESGISS